MSSTASSTVTKFVSQPSEETTDKRLLPSDSATKDVEPPSEPTKPSHVFESESHIRRAIAYLQDRDNKGNRKHIVKLGGFRDKELATCKAMLFLKNSEAIKSILAKDKVNQAYLKKRCVECNLQGWDDPADADRLVKFSYEYIVEKKRKRKLRAVPKESKPARPAANSKPRLSTANETNLNSATHQSHVRPQIHPQIQPQQSVAQSFAGHHVEMPPAITKRDHNSVDDDSNTDTDASEEGHAHGKIVDDGLDEQRKRKRLDDGWTSDQNAHTHANTFTAGTSMQHDGPREKRPSTCNTNTKGADPLAILANEALRRRRREFKSEEDRHHTNRNDTNTIDRNTMGTKPPTTYVSQRFVSPSNVPVETPLLGFVVFHMWWKNQFDLQKDARDLYDVSMEEGKRIWNKYKNYNLPLVSYLSETKELRSSLRDPCVTNLLNTTTLERYGMVTQIGFDAISGTTGPRMTMFEAPIEHMLQSVFCLKAKQCVGKVPNARFSMNGDLPMQRGTVRGNDSSKHWQHSSNTQWHAIHPDSPQLHWSNNAPDEQRQGHGHGHGQGQRQVNSGLSYRSGWQHAVQAERKPVHSHGEHHEHREHREHSATPSALFDHVSDHSPITKSSTHATHGTHATNAPHVTDVTAAPPVISKSSVLCDTCKKRTGGKNFCGDCGLPRGPKPGGRAPWVNASHVQRACQYVWEPEHHNFLVSCKTEEEWMEFLKTDVRFSSGKNNKERRLNINTIQTHLNKYRKHLGKSIVKFEWKETGDEAVRSCYWSKQRLVKKEQQDHLGMSPSQMHTHAHTYVQPSSAHAHTYTHPTTHARAHHAYPLNVYPQSQSNQFSSEKSWNGANNVDSGNHVHHGDATPTVTSERVGSSVSNKQPSPQPSRQPPPHQPSPQPARYPTPQTNESNVTRVYHRGPEDKGGIRMHSDVHRTHNVTAQRDQRHGTTHYEKHKETVH